MIHFTRTFRVSAAAFLASAILMSCSKDKTEKDPVKEIEGTWMESSIHASLINYLEFHSDGTFSSTYKNSNESATVISGTYSVKGDSLKVHVAKQTTKVNGQSDAFALDDNDVYDKCTFKIKDNVLSLNYISYPADAPVKTNAVFIRVTNTH